MKRRNFLKQAGRGVGLTAIMPFVQGKPVAASHTEAMTQRTVRSMDSSIDINLSHLGWNISRINQIVRVPIMAVVKANAYGHGLIGVSRFLERQGFDWLMVGNIGEAIELRAGGVRCRILNFGAFSRKDAEEIVNHDISQAVWGDEAVYLDEAARKKGKRVSIHVDIDTGMGRTGVPWTRALPFLSRLATLDRIKIEGTMTTLTEDEDFDFEQLQRFQEVCSRAKENGISVGLRHVASSAGILASPQFHLDMVRPGIMIYGYYPSEKTQKEDRLALKPVAQWRAHVIDIRELAAGDTLSYHRVFKATELMRVATLGAGYFDGYPALLAGKSHVFINGKKFPVIAAVTANHMMVDLLGDATIKIGDEVLLLDNRAGVSLTADILAKLAETSVYKILIGLNPLLPRRYK